MEPTAADQVTPAAHEPVSKRITVGAKIAEWRMVPSQRKALDGWFVQGGSFQLQANGRNHFVVGSELFFADRAAAQATLKERR
jgi:hypothetical protein